ncbi:hypothetical protein BJ508DRAFT_345965 [Ascobolus immersus RN42]|uniref:Uncharacterized protein n=1 Tax=Ascobolus immersus RN42 TaxID=1160509 RepID=A0A3N4H8E1_ASCIM|nr:hypothetical protein BJ508DRAFT_345965 [Ascobolus immersus RN42]
MHGPSCSPFTNFRSQQAAQTFKSQRPPQTNQTKKASSMSPPKRAQKETPTSEAGLSLETQIRKLEAQRKQFLTSLNLCTERMQASHRYFGFATNGCTPIGDGIITPIQAPPLETAIPKNLEEVERQVQMLSYYEIFASLPIAAAERARTNSLSFLFFAFGAPIHFLPQTSPSPRKGQQLSGSLLHSQPSGSKAKRYSMPSSSTTKDETESKSNKALQARILKLEARRKHFLTSLDFSNERQKCNFDALVALDKAEGKVSQHPFYSVKIAPTFNTTPPQTIEEVEHLECQLRNWEDRLRLWRQEQRISEMRYAIVVAKDQLEMQVRIVEAYDYARSVGIYTGKEARSFPEAVDALNSTNQKNPRAFW